MTKIDDSRSGTAGVEIHNPQSGYFLVTGESVGRSDGITLIALWNIFWSERLLIIAISLVFAIGSITAALMMTPIYRADSVLAPVDDGEMPNVTGRIGGLASLAGIQMGGSDGTNAVAILRSREFAADFITEKKLMPLFYDDSWDAEANDWATKAPEEIPQLFDAVKDFHESIYSVKEDPVSGLVTIAIEWKDPELAAKWVNSLVERINSETRSRALRVANLKLLYLKDQLEKATVLELRTAISRLIESELKTIMIANAREQYAFSVIDPAMVPTEKVRPRRSLIVVTSTCLGGLLALVVALMRHSLRHSHSEREQSAGQGTVGS